MKDLTLTQEFILCALNEKGNYSAWSYELPICSIASALLELQLADCLKVENKKVIITNPLPANKENLHSLYHYLEGGKPKKLETIAGDYGMSFSGKLLKALLEDICESLVVSKDVEKKQGGFFHNKDLYVPSRESVDHIIQKIRAELLEEGELTDEVVALAVLLDKCDHLKQYFSKYEAKQLKQRLKELKKSESCLIVTQMIDYITTMIVIIAAS